MTTQPVVVSLNVEGFGEHVTESHEIDRTEWDGMTPGERAELLDDMAAVHAGNYLAWGWSLADPDDMDAITA